jgi:hypothetical protein
MPVAPDQIAGRQTGHVVAHRDHVADELVAR